MRFTSSMTIFTKFTGIISHLENLQLVHQLLVYFTKVTISLEFDQNLFCQQSEQRHVNFFYSIIYFIYFYIYIFFTIYFTVNNLFA